MDMDNVDIFEMEDIQYLVVLVTASSEEEGLKIASALVDAEMVACVNMIEKVRSIFKWRGKVEDEKETLLIIKTRTERMAEVVAKVKEVHSYDVPEVIALPVVEGNQSYLRWIDEVT